MQALAGVWTGSPTIQDTHYGCFGCCREALIGDRWHCVKLGGPIFPSFAQMGVLLPPCRYSISGNESSLGSE